MNLLSSFVPIIIIIICLFLPLPLESSSFEAKSCTELWLKYGVRESGNYSLMVSDEDSRDCPGGRIQVECDMSDALAWQSDVDRDHLDRREQVFEIKTIVHHDSEESRLVQGYESPGSFERNIVYGLATSGSGSNQLQCIDWIIQQSYTCQQYIRWDCKGSVFNFWFQHYHNWWLDRRGRTQTYWGGAEPDSRSCGCFPYCHPTTKNSTCNCDANIKTDWLEDSGLLLAKDRLPVTQLRFGDTGESYEVGRYTLGPLICREHGHRNVTFGEFRAPVNLTSPGFPKRYPPAFRRYQWTVLVDRGQLIEMVFTEYDVIHYGAYVSVPGCRYAVSVDVFQEPKAEDPEPDPEADQIEHGGKRWTLVYRIRREKSSPPYYVTDGRETLFRLQLITCNQNRSTTIHDHHQGFRVEFRPAKCSACAMRWPGGVVPINTTEVQCVVRPDQCLYVYSLGYPFAHYVYGQHIDHRLMVQQWNLKTTAEDHILQMEFNDFDVIVTPGQHYCDADLLVIQQPLPPQQAQQNQTKQQQQQLNYCNINRFDIGKFTSGSSQIQLRLQTSLKKVGNSRGIHAMIRSIRKHRPSPINNLTLTTTTAAASTPGSGGHKSRWIKNAAVGRPTDQSSTRANREPSLAVDDNYEQREAAKCSSTNYEREPWWRVNLQKRHRIHGVRIYGYLGKHETIPIQPMFWERNMDVCTTSLCERQWPQGNYGLPMPSSGCPSSTEGGRWLHGMRFHAVQYDKPYDDKIRYWSENIMLKGGATSDGIEQHFCIHQDDHHHRSSLVTNDGDTSSTSSTTKPVVNPNPNQSSCSANDTCQWQPGKYCILKYGDTCPEGFQVGSLTWFDKSSNASINNHHQNGHHQSDWNQNPSRKHQLFNSIHGTVPAGEYTTHNTTIYYCCREDGDPTKPINLPKTRPFYLFQYGRICQEVAGMSEMEHFFHYEEEVVLYGSIPDLVFTTGQKLKFQDPHPRIEVTLFDRGMTLHYCYYDIADKLKGFQVLVDTTPDTFGYGRVYDKDTGITRPVNKPFLSAVECAHYGTTEEEFDQITLNCSQPIEGQYVIIFMKERQDALQLCEVVVFGEESCGRPLGMATEEILDSAITASSFDSTKGLVYHPYNVRLNSFAAWCTNNLDQEKYIQIDLRLQNSNIVFDSKLPLGDESNWNNVNYVTIVGVAMQGMPNGFKSYFITHFQVLFSNDSRHWSFEEEPIGKQKVYKCVQCEAQHVDPNEVVMYNLLKPVVARFLRIKILAFRGGPCMRLELIGCRGDKKNFCSRTLTASTPGVISSPNYPFYYAQYKSCVWNIKPANPDGHIELDFIVLDLAPAEKSGGGKCLDQLIIYHSRAQSPITIEAGSGGLIHRLHSFKQQNFPKKIISNGPVMLNLKTCFRFSKTRYQGFLVRFRETDCPGCGIGDSRCSRLYNCSSLCGRIFSINYPLNYLNNYRCRWLIRAPAGHYFNISIEDFDVFSQPITAYATAANYNNSSSSTTSGPTHRPVKNCLYDHLSFIDPSTGIVLGRYCNTNKPSKHILSNWNELLIEFSTDSSGNGRGFKLQYKAKRYDLLPEARRFLLPPNACPSGWLYFRGYCYKSFMEDESLQWYEAEEKCAQKAKGRDGHLVSITDYLEMNVVHYWIIEQWQMPPHQTIYIGLIDTNREGFYNWSDGNPMSYTDWYRSNFIGSSPLTGDSTTSTLDNNARNWSASSLSGSNQADWSNHYHQHQSSASLRSSIINGFNDLNNYFNQYSQPDGGAYEDCTVINFYSIHSTLNWHDVPCSLGKKVMPASKLQTLSPAPVSTPTANSGHMISGSGSNNSTTHITSNNSNSSSSSSSGGSGNNRRVQHHHHNDGLIRSYICKMDSNSSLHQYSPRRPLFQIRIGEEEKNQIKSKVDLNRYFVCNNFEVISNLFRCDGTANCRDGSDETEGCSISDKCLESQFQCANGHCIAIGKYCDFIDDCGDGSDEIFCFRPQCKKNSEFRCNNEQCIPNYKRCDLFHDCRDQSDEDNCNGKCNLNTTFQCYYGNCIPLYALCDRHRDCPGKFFEDEHETVCSAIVMNGGGAGGSSATYSASAGHGRKRRRISSSEASRASTYSNDCQRQRDTRRETCQDLLEYQNIHQDGYYDLQPMAGNQLTLRVFCRFLNETHATTIINHDSEDRLYVRSSIDAPGSYVRIITYEGSLDLILTLIDSSEQCKQFVSYECSGSRFNFNTPKPNSWWVSRHGFREYSWGTDQPLACACYPNCISNLRCNCDAGLMFNWTRDYGYVRDRSKLPIRQVAFGEVYHIGQLGYVQVGPVECTGKSRPSNHHHHHHRDRLDCWQQAANIFRCNSGQIIDGKDVCLYEFDQLQYQIGCRDVSHLRNCSQHQCPPDYVKCPDSYCIPYRYLCNGKWDCVGGSDEIGCARYTCPGRYKCANESSCIWLHQLCDGFRHCPLGDDEWFCDLNCPESCICIGHFVDCRDSRNITREVLKSISRDTRKLDLSGNNLGPDLSAIDFSPYTYLGELILQNNQLEVIRSRKFIQLANLYKLDLRHNNIKIIEAAAFAGLQQVTTLMLDHNPLLEQIHSGAFVGLISLRRLNISNTQLNRLVKNLFLQMSSLQHLTLVNNQIDTIEKGAFNDLISLMSLDLRGNPIRTFSKDMFAMLKSLRNLATDSFKFCCMVSGNVPFSRCYPPQDEISDCEDLMSNTVQRLILWILGFGALIGNLWVVIWRLKTKNQTNRVSSTLILWLGFSDFLMGVYLIIIASVDEYYRGHYIENSDYWKNSIWCKLCGFLSTLSSETSVMTLVFITIDRLISISFSFSAYRFTVKCAYRLLVLTWIIMFIISGLPLLPIDYFKGQFYSRSGVCLAFHITANKWPGWEYSVAIFLVFNLFAFLFILFCYLYMYKTIRGAVKKRRQMRAKQLRETNIGLQMALIVITNFLCWFPVIIMGLMALAGVPIPGAAYSWIAVLVLPLNSATNPLIYTLIHFVPNLLSSQQQQQRQQRSEHHHHPHLHQSNSNINGTNGGSVVQMRLTSIKQQQQQQSRQRQLSRDDGSIISVSMHRILMRTPPGYQTLNEFLRTKEPLTPNDLLEICHSLSETIKDHHQMGFAFGSLNCENIFVTIKPIKCTVPSLEDTTTTTTTATTTTTTTTATIHSNDQPVATDMANVQRLQAYIPPFNLYQVANFDQQDDPSTTGGGGPPQQSTTTTTIDHDDFAMDMEEFGKVIKRMLQVYHSRQMRDRSQNSFAHAQNFK